MPPKSLCKPSQSSRLLVQGFLVTPTSICKHHFFATLNTYHLPRQNSGEAAIGEPGADSPPGTLLSPWKPKSPELPQSLVGGGRSQAALVTQAQPRNSQKGNLNRNTKHLTFYFQSKTSVKKKKRASRHPTPLLQLVKGFPGVGSHPTALGAWGASPAAPVSLPLPACTPQGRAALVYTAPASPGATPSVCPHWGNSKPSHSSLCLPNKFIFHSETVRALCLGSQLKAWTLGPNSLCSKTFSSTF